MPLWTPADDSLLRAVYVTGTITTIRDTHFPERTRSAVQQRALHLGLSRGHRPRKGTVRRRYTADADYFARRTPESTYWAGFIAADGCLALQARERPLLKVAVSATDEAHLTLLREALAFTGPITRYVQTTNVGTNEMVSLRIYGVDAWRRDLRDIYGITERKSPVLPAPPSNLSPECELAYLRGLIDGDGTVDLVAGRYRRLTLRGTAAICGWMKSLADRLAPSERPASVHTTRHPALYAITGSRADILGAALLSVDGPRLERKWKLFTENPAFALAD